MLPHPKLSNWPLTATSKSSKVLRGRLEFTGPGHEDTLGRAGHLNFDGGPQILQLLLGGRSFISPRQTQHATISEGFTLTKMHGMEGSLCGRSS